MIRTLLIPALLTGVFCALFSVGIDWLTNMLERGQVIALSFLSGFGGSLFSNLVLKRRN